jgi:hypothetical protein
MTPKEAGQRIRALVDDAAKQLHEPGGTPTRRTFETMADAAAIIGHFAIEQCQELSSELRDAMIASRKSNQNVLVAGSIHDIATNILDELAMRVEEQLVLSTPQPPISVDPTPEDAKRRATMAVLKSIEEAAGAFADEPAKLHQLARALNEFGGSQVNAAQIADLVMRAEWLRAAQDVMKKAGVETQQHPAKAVQILVDQRAEARATIATLETELAKTKAAASARESTAAVHVYLDTLRIPDGKLWDRLQCLGAVRNRLDNAGFNADDISLAVRDALAAASAAKSHADEAQRFRAELSKTKTDFEVERATVRELASDAVKIQGALDQASTEIAKLRGLALVNDVTEMHKLLDDAKVEPGHIVERVKSVTLGRNPETGLMDNDSPCVCHRVLNEASVPMGSLLERIRHLINEDKRLQGELRKANDAIAERPSRGQLQAAKEELEDMRKIIDNERRAHQLTSGSLQNANDKVTDLQKRLDDAHATMARLRQELEAANEQVALQSRTIKCLAALLDTEATTKDLMALGHGLLELEFAWRRGGGSWSRDAAEALSNAITKALGKRYDAFNTALHVREAPKPPIPIGVVVASAASGEVVPVEFAKRKPSEF